MYSAPGHKKQQFLTLFMLLGTMKNYICTIRTTLGGGGLNQFKEELLKAKCYSISTVNESIVLIVALQ